MAKISDKTTTKTDFSKTFGQLRREVNMTQAELADALGTSRATVTAYESGIRYPSPQTLKRICSFFNVEMNFLTGNSPVRLSSTSISPKESALCENVIVYDRKHLLGADEESSDSYMLFFDDAFYLYTVSLPKANMGYDATSPHFAIVANESDYLGGSAREDDICVFEQANIDTVYEGDVVCALLEGKACIRKAHYETKTGYIAFIKDADEMPEVLALTDANAAIIGKLKAVIGFRNK